MEDKRAGERQLEMSEEAVGGGRTRAHIPMDLRRQMVHGLYLNGKRGRETCTAQQADLNLEREAAWLEAQIFEATFTQGQYLKEIDRRSFSLGPRRQTPNLSYSTPSPAQRVINTSNNQVISQPHAPQSTSLLSSPPQQQPTLDNQKPQIRPVVHPYTAESYQQMLTNQAMKLACNQKQKSRTAAPPVFSSMQQTAKISGGGSVIQPAAAVATKHMDDQPPRMVVAPAVSSSMQQTQIFEANYTIQPAAAVATQELNNQLPKTMVNLKQNQLYASQQGSILENNSAALTQHMTNKHVMIMASLQQNQKTITNNGFQGLTQKENPVQSQGLSIMQGDFQKSVQKSRHSSMVSQNMRNQQATGVINLQRNQFVTGNNGFQGLMYTSPQPRSAVANQSQGTSIQGTKDDPILVSESTVDQGWQDKAYKELQDCKAACYVSIENMCSNLQKNIQDRVGDKERIDLWSSWVPRLEESLKFLRMHRSSMAQITQEYFFTHLTKIKNFIHVMRQKHSSKSLVQNGGDSNSRDPKVQQSEPPSTNEANHTRQQPTLILNQWRDTPRETSSSMPLQVPDWQSAPHLQQSEKVATPLIDSCVVASGGRSNYQVNQSPVERLIKAVSSSSPEALHSGARDILAVTSIADSIDEIPACGDTEIFIDENPFFSTNDYSNVQNEEVPDQRMMRNISVAEPYDIFGIDSFINSGCHTLSSSESPNPGAKRLKTGVNDMLMKEISFLNQKLLETSLMLEEQQGADDKIVVCKYRPLGSAADIQLPHLFPVFMRLKIPTDDPNSAATVIPCSHFNCGELCKEVHIKYERYCRSYETTTPFKKIVEDWEILARNVYMDICLSYGGGNFSSRYGTWEKFSAM